MTRSGDSGVTITVRIKFLNQDRNGVDPNAARCAPPDTPPLGTLIGSTRPRSPRPIRAAHGRRRSPAGAVAHWNGHLTLVGEEWNLTEDNTKKRLPVTFQSVPVFGLDEQGATPRSSSTLRRWWRARPASPSMPATTT